MRRIRSVFLIAIATAGVLPASNVSAQTVDITPYAWQFPVAGTVNAPDMVGRLQEEVQKVLNAGRLTPQRTYYADQGSFEEYWQYMQPGRIITTLAWAYPYLTPAQQTGVKSYVAAELADATHAPWSASPMSVTTGTTRRELSPLNRPTYFTPQFATAQPSVHTIYGLWLYAWKTQDWGLIQGYWATIKSMYSARSAQGDIYGTMSAHVAMARLADKFGDTATRTTALNNLQTQLNAGVTFATIESRVSSKYWPEMYVARRSGGVYQGWMFLNLSPEIGRYLNDKVRTDTLTRNSSGKAKYPLWWLRIAPYSGRWTGDEGVGIPTEMMGMVMPVERWVAGTSAAALTDYMRSGPTAIGDCYWLEALVLAIEANGTTTWTDVRTGSPAPTPTAPTNLRIVGE
jgi:hypothetical protein